LKSGSIEKNDGFYSGKKSVIPSFIFSLNSFLSIFKYRGCVSYLGVFGSYIRGEQTGESDLDVFVEFDEAPGLEKIEKFTKRLEFDEFSQDDQSCAGAPRCKQRGMFAPTLWF